MNEYGPQNIQMFHVKKSQCKENSSGFARKMHCPRSGMSRTGGGSACWQGDDHSEVAEHGDGGYLQGTLTPKSGFESNGVILNTARTWRIGRISLYIGVQGGTTVRRGPSSHFLEILGIGPEVDLPQLSDGGNKVCPL